MPRNMLRMFSVVTRYRERLAFSQFLLFISAVCTVGFATMIETLVNDCMVAGDAGTAMSTGFWMFILTVIAGVSMAVHEPVQGRCAGWHGGRGY